MENKLISFAIVEGKIVIGIDPNKNGKPVLTVIIDPLEVPAEIASLFIKKEVA